MYVAVAVLLSVSVAWIVRRPVGAVAIVIAQPVKLPPAGTEQVPVTEPPPTTVNDTVELGSNPVPLAVNPDVGRVLGPFEESVRVGSGAMEVVSAAQSVEALRVAKVVYDPVVTAPWDSAYAKLAAPPTMVVNPAPWVNVELASVDTSPKIRSFAMVVDTEGPVTAVPVPFKIVAGLAGLNGFWVFAPRTATTTPLPPPAPLLTVTVSALEV